MEAAKFVFRIWTPGGLRNFAGAIGIADLRPERGWPCRCVLVSSRPAQLEAAAAVHMARNVRYVGCTIVALTLP
jgi:hypothetical protein